MSLKPGCIPAIIYFERRNGHVTLAPFTDCPTPEGSIRKECDTLPALDRLHKKMLSQILQELEQEHQMEEAIYAKRRQELDDRFDATLMRSDIPEFEKQVIKHHRYLRDEERRKKWEQRYLEATTWHFYARDYDLGSRDASKEEFKWEKHEDLTRGR